MPARRRRRRRDRGLTHVSPTTKLLAGVELGGTKCVCILGTGPDDVRAMERLPTGEREETLRQIEAVLDRWRQQHGAARALGIASFGPVDLRADSPTYGFITSTTKPGWRDTDVAQRLGRRFGIPVGFDTDVNGAALAEGRWGAAVGLDDFAYVTVGTGIGVGTIVRGRPVFGMNHTELGHIRVARKRRRHVCRRLFLFTATASRAWHRAPPSKRAPAGRPRSCRPIIRHGSSWRTDSRQLMHTMVLTTAPQRIFLGGGVMSAQTHLFERIRQELKRSLNGYVEAPQLEQGLAQFIVPPGLGAMAGPLGALALAADAANPVAAHPAIRRRLPRLRFQFRSCWVGARRSATKSAMVTSLS